MVGLDPGKLGDGIRSGFVDGVNGLRMHVLEAGFDPPNRPRVLLLHGFPELAYSWRKVMGPLAAAGFHVIAPDQRGYGLTTGWDPDYDGDLASFRILNLVRDALALVSALGYRSVEAVVGHDFGSPVAAYCALIRPDVFRSVALMSAPFGGPPAFPFGTADGHGANEAGGDHPAKADLPERLAALARPRKHYQHYYGTRAANDDMRNCPQGLAAFLRAYFHYKSADWAGNNPSPLRSWAAEELAKMPTYYIMDLDAGMAETVAPYMPSDEDIAACAWLSEEELKFYAEEFSRTGFQGGLQWYRCTYSTEQSMELCLYSGRSIDVPACFIAGEKDWGVYQRPGAVETMRTHACSRMQSVDLVPGAGHWVQQEQPDEVVSLLKRFLS
ncbi:MAG: alpha/beta fold hydrolase [Geminicoccaceae bacterium]